MAIHKIEVDTLPPARISLAATSAVFTHPQIAFPAPTQTSFLLPGRIDFLHDFRIYKKTLHLHETIANQKSSSFLEGLGFQVRLVC